MTTGASPARDANSASARTRLDGALSLLLFLGAAALYWTTAAPSLYVGDCPEIAAAIALRGVPHPPGYPLFTHGSALLHGLLPEDWADAAGRANLVVGLYGAAAVALAFAFARRCGIPRSGALFTALALATGATFWGQSLASEVYSFDVLLFFVAGHAALSVRRDSASARAWIVLGMTLGLWVGHRSLNALFVLPWIALLLPRLRDPGSAKRVGLGIGTAAAVVASGWLTLLATSRADPALDVGDPESWSRLWTVVRGAPYGRHLGEGEFAQTAHRWGRFVRGAFLGTALEEHGCREETGLNPLR